MTEKTINFLKHYTSIVMALTFTALFIEWVMLGDSVNFWAMVIWSPICVYIYQTFKK